MVTLCLHNHQLAGICDPHDSEECKKHNNWDFCGEAEFVCDPLNDEGENSIFFIYKSSSKLY